MAAAHGNLRGPAQLVLTASVARRYYLDGRSKVEIAEEFSLSRFKVARLLDDARSSGLVRIEIGHPGVVDVELSARLMEALGLTHCVVTDTPDDHPATLREHLGAAAAELLTEIVTTGGRAGPVVGAVGERHGRSAAGARPGGGRAAHGRAGPTGCRRQLDRAGAGGRARRGRARVLLLRPDGRPRPDDGAGAARSAGGGAGVRADRVGDEGGRRGRRVGAGAVDAVRRHERGRTRRAGPHRGVRRGVGRAHRRRRASPCPPR